MVSSYSVRVFCIRWSLLIYHFASFPVTPFSPCLGFAHQGSELVPRHIILFGRDETSQTASAASLAPYRPPSSSLLSLPLTSNPCPTFFSHLPFDGAPNSPLLAASHSSLSAFLWSAVLVSHFPPASANMAALSQGGGWTGDRHNKGGGEQFDRVTLTHTTKFILPIILMREPWAELATVIGADRRKWKQVVETWKRSRALWTSEMCFSASSAYAFFQILV